MSASNAVGKCMLENKEEHMQAIKHAVMDGVMSIDRDCRVGHEGQRSQTWAARQHHGLELEPAPPAGLLPQESCTVECLLIAS